MNAVDFFNSVFLPFGLIAISFGMGLSLTVADLKRVVVFPKAAAIGFVGQLVMLPLLALALGLLLPVSPALAVGAIILAGCPGGATSNAYVFAAKADLALSVTLTSIASFIIVFTLPLMTYVGLQLHFDAGQMPDIPVGEMLGKLASLTIAPISAGIAVRAWRPVFALRWVEVFRRLALGILITLIVGLTIISFDQVVKYIAAAGVIALLLNVLSMSMGYVMARGFKLSDRQSVTITYEIGVQNLSLAFLVTLNILGRPDLAIVTLVYAPIMKITALSFLVMARRICAKEEAEYGPLIEAQKA